MLTKKRTSTETKETTSQITVSLNTHSKKIVSSRNKVFKPKLDSIPEESEGVKPLIHRERKTNKNPKFIPVTQVFKNKNRGKNYNERTASTDKFASFEQAKKNILLKIGIYGDESGNFYAQAGIYINTIVEAFFSQNKSLKLDDHTKSTELFSQVVRLVEFTERFLDLVSSYELKNVENLIDPLKESFLKKLSKCTNLTGDSLEQAVDSMVTELVTQSKKLENGSPLKLSIANVLSHYQQPENKENKSLPLDLSDIDNLIQKNDKNKMLYVVVKNLLTQIKTNLDSFLVKVNFSKNADFSANLVIYRKGLAEFTELAKFFKDILNMLGSYQSSNPSKESQQALVEIREAIQTQITACSFLTEGCVKSATETLVLMLQTKVSFLPEGGALQTTIKEFLKKYPGTNSINIALKKAEKRIETHKENKEEKASLQEIQFIARRINSIKPIYETSFNKEIKSDKYKLLKELGDNVAQLIDLYPEKISLAEISSLVRSQLETVSAKIGNLSRTFLGISTAVAKSDLQEIVDKVKDEIETHVPAATNHKKT